MVKSPGLLLISPLGRKRSLHSAEENSEIGSSARISRHIGISTSNWINRPSVTCSQAARRWDLKASSSQGLRVIKKKRRIQKMRHCHVQSCAHEYYEHSTPSSQICCDARLFPLSSSKVDSEQKACKVARIYLGTNVVIQHSVDHLLFLCLILFFGLFLGFVLFLFKHATSHRHQGLTSLSIITLCILGRSC